MIVESSYGDLGWSKRNTTWKERLAILPHRCTVSGKLIWLKFAMVATRGFTGPGTPIFQTHWFSKEEHLILSLKGII